MIRIAKASDAKAIFHIEKTMFKDDIYFGLSLNDIEKLLKKSSTIFYVYCDQNNTPVGYALGINVNKNAIWFNSLAVLKDFQSTPAAKLLFEKIEQTAVDLNMSSIILEIRQDNKALLRRYKNMGYCIWKEILAYYPDKCPAIRMIKKL